MKKRVGWKMQKVGFAVFFVVATLGAVLLLISQIPLTREYYEVVETRSFSVGGPLTFYFTFEPNVRYRFEVKGTDWSSQPYYTHYMYVGGTTYPYDPGGTLVENPPSGPMGNWSDTGAPITQTLNVTVWHWGNGVEIDQAIAHTVVEVSAFREATYRLTYLIYVGLPLLIISAIVITVTGKDADSRMRMPDARESH